ncbi:DUF3662 and FHA domain-containing protein [Corynebacterium cystitidis]|uniref:DUF3662 and FHA domain-containing protein n=1 Tax=Corynebacterium cystitidis TaxID=35757 RepID=UPI00211EF7DA|nr:DUF3662 and FHA domain-containing protein [Corynebacterium cystitidis]
MGLMDRLAKFDSSLQRGLDNGFAAIFGGRVVPAEIEELLKQEAQDNVTETQEQRLMSPNVFAVGVSSKDLENLSQERELPERLADQLMRYIRNQGWALAGFGVVRIAEESGLRTGQLSVSSYIDPDPDVASGFDAIVAEAKRNSAQPTPGSTSTSHSEVSKEDDMLEPNSVKPVSDAHGPAVSLLLQDGSSRTYLVHEGSNIIGRSNDSDFRLPDTGVSRQHAEITWDGHDAVLTDLQSTNGTTVNDENVDNWLLQDGDVITIGHSNIEVRIVGPSR